MRLFSNQQIAFMQRGKWWRLWGLDKIVSFQVFPCRTTYGIECKLNRVTFFAAESNWLHFPQKILPFQLP